MREIEVGAKSWTGLSGGAWSADANWSPTGAAAANDDVTLTGPAAGTLTVRGPGAANSLTLIGNTGLTGSVQTATLSVGTAAAAGGLALAAGAALRAGTATIIYGPLQASGAGTTLTVTGVLTLGGTRANAFLHGDNSLNLVQGATARVGTLVLAPTFGQVSVSVDAQSSLEVGSAGSGAAAGQITVDAGATLAGTGSLLAGSGVVNQGNITARTGGLTITGGVTGNGTLSIAAGGQLSLLGRVSTEPVTFAGTGGTLEVTSVYGPVGGILKFALSEAGTINGFGPGQTIYYFGTAPLSAVTYAAGTGGLGTLSLISGTINVGTLVLAGNFTGETFQVTPHGITGSDITVVASAPAGSVASVGTTAPDAYGWTSATGGAWGNAGNWQDITAGANPAPIAPGAQNTVTLNGTNGGAYSVIAGPANAAALLVLGHVALSGMFNAGTVAVGSSHTGGGLSIGTASTLNAATLTLLNGPLQAIGAGSQVVISGTATLGGIAPPELTQAGADLLSASVGAVVQVGQLLLTPSLIGNQVTVDGTSSLELGFAGRAAPGLLTIDAGRSLSGVGFLNAAGGVLNNGTISASGGTLSIYGGVGGTGSMQIGPGALLWLNGAASSQGAAFTGPGAILEVTPVPGPGGVDTVLSKARSQDSAPVKPSAISARAP